MKVTPVVWDRTINLPFLFTVAVALTAAVVWTSQVNSRLDGLEDRTRGLPEVERQMAVMVERSAATKESLARIERELERSPAP